MNSSLQALYSCDAFANIFLLEPQPMIRSNTNGLIGNIIKLFKACRDSPPNKSVDPSSFKVALSKVFPQYSNSNQHDSALFIWSLIDTLCDIVGHPPGTIPLDWTDTRFPVKNNEISPSIVRDILGLKEYRSKTYHPCNHKVELSTVFNSMLILNIPNNPNPTLAQCLNNYALQDGLMEDSICGACGKASNRNDKSLKLINARQMLLMNIARFSIDEGIASKNETPISIPLILENLGNLSTEETNKYSYQLTGVVHHSGTLTGGHYTASVRMNDGTWLYCNDSTITKNAEFEREMREQNGSFKAVVLVYSRMNKNPKVGGKYGNTTKRRKRCPIRRIKKQNRS
jgi:ubiquitin C-terminal hydrolase